MSFMRFTLLLNAKVGDETDDLNASFDALAVELARLGHEVRLYTPGTEPGKSQGVMHASPDMFDVMEPAGVLLLAGAPHDCLAATPAQVKWYWSLEPPQEHWASMILHFCDRVLSPSRAHREQLLRRWPALKSVSLVPLNSPAFNPPVVIPKPSATVVFGFANSVEQSFELAELLRPIRELAPAPSVRIIGRCVAETQTQVPAADRAIPAQQSCRPSGTPSPVSGDGIALCLWPHTICALLQVIEAMRAGSVVIGPLEGWLSEVVGDAGCLLAVRPDEPEFGPRLLAEIRALVERPDRLRCLADQARARAASEFSPQSTASRLVEMLGPDSEKVSVIPAVEKMSTAPSPRKTDQPFPPSRSPSSICVVIPIRNQARYLARALGSVTWQLGPQDEVIVVDDASEDLGSFSPRAAFRQRIMWLRNDRQCGVSFSRNRAIRRSRAEWIKFLDADDILVPFALETVRHPDAPFAPEAVVVGGGCHRILDGQHLDYLDGTARSLKDILHANPLLPSATFVRRLALLEVGLFDERIDFEEDWDLWLRLHRRFGAAGFAASGVPICYYWIGTKDRESVSRRATVDGVPVREYFRRQYRRATLLSWPRPISSIQPHITMSGNPRYCYWSVVDGDYAIMAETLVNSVRRAGAFTDFHLWTDRPVQGAICHDAGQFDKWGCLFKLTFLRESVQRLNYDYFIWLDTDCYFVRHPGDILRVLKGSPMHITLECDLCRPNNRRLDWWGCPNATFAELLRRQGVRSRSIYNVNGGFFVIHHDAVETVVSLATEFWHAAKAAGYTFNDEPLLAYAMQMLCGDPLRHTLKENADVWASDWTGYFAGELPDGQPWWFADYFTEEVIPVDPAIVHAMRSKEAMLLSANSH